MAGILRGTGGTGFDLYANIISVLDGKYVNGTLLEDYDAGSDGDYRFNLTETGSKGFYTAPFPSIAAGVYIVMIYQDGVLDPQGSYSVNWDGTSEVINAGAATIRDSILDATITPPTAAPAAPYTPRSVLGWLLAITKFKRTQTASTETVFQDDGTTPAATSVKTDAAGVLTRAEYS